MIKKLTAHGNSAALIIDKPILELLKITMDTPLEISTDGKRLIVAPIISENNREEDIKAALEKINSRRRSALKKLKQYLYVTSTSDVVYSFHYVKET